MGLSKSFDKLLKIVCVPGLLDTPYIWIKYVYNHRRIPRRNSRLFNDYLYLRKSSSSLYDILCQATSDKILVKDYVAARLGQGAVLPVIRIFEDADNIDVDDLPKPCVIKSAHGSGDVVYIKEGAADLKPSERRKMAKALEGSLYDSMREKNYRHLRRRLVCEPMLPEAEMIKDYKIFCFKGHPQVIQVDSSRHTGHRRNMYDTNWSLLNIEYGYPRGAEEDAPKRLDDMLAWARKLSADFEFVRVDFFSSGNELFISELTHCPESAAGRFGSMAQEREFSRMIFDPDSQTKEAPPPV